MKSHRVIFAAIFAVATLAAFGAVAQNPPAGSVPDPAADAMRIALLLEKEGADVAAVAIAEAVGNPASHAGLTPHLVPFGKRTPGVRAIAADRDYGGVIRNIVIYQHGISAELQFTYLRFVYKRTDKGWHLTHFNINSEGQMPFPNGYGIN